MPYSKKAVDREIAKDKRITPREARAIHALLKGRQKTDEPPPRRRHKAPIGECTFCDHERAQGNDFHPSHDASARCESGKRAHCSCDTCF